MGRGHKAYKAHRHGGRQVIQAIQNGTHNVNVNVTHTHNAKAMAHWHSRHRPIRYKAEGKITTEWHEE